MPPRDNINTEITMQLFGLPFKRTSFEIKKVIFNPPATIVLWEDGTKTVVKTQWDIGEIAASGCDCCGGVWARIDTYDPEKGLAMAIAKKALGNKGNYYNVFKKWLKENE